MLRKGDVFHRMKKNPRFSLTLVISALSEGTRKLRKLEYWMRMPPTTTKVALLSQPQLTHSETERSGVSGTQLA